MEDREKVNKKRLSILVSLAGIFLIVLSFLFNSTEEILSGLFVIATSPSILITDYFEIANPGAAFLNAGLVTLIGLALAWIINARFNGYLLAAIFTLMGFSFFGKNVYNIWPIFLGVYVYDKIFSHQPMKDLIAPVLFGTTLSPIVSQVSFGFGWGWKGVVFGIIIGIISGILLAALMKHIYSFHLGYNLYNTGTTGGFVGIVAYMMMRGFGLDIKPLFFWSVEHTQILMWVVLSILSVIILLGFLWGGRISAYKEIYKESGQLATDFVENTDLGTTLINMGLVGLIALLYVILVSGDINGPVLAGILTVVGFGALGKHPRNIIPVMLGVYLICIPKIWLHNEPGPLLAALFCTTVAPLSGKFGFSAGLLAGMLHLPMVMHVGGLHGYMNLYNNGFAGGLAMLIIVGFIKGLRPYLLEENA